MLNINKIIDNGMAYNEVGSLLMIYQSDCASVNFHFKIKGVKFHYFRFKFKIFILDTKIEILSKNDNVSDVIYAIQQVYYEIIWRQFSVTLNQQYIVLKNQSDQSQIKLDRNLILDTYYDDLCTYIICEKFIIVIKQNQVALQFLVQYDDNPIQLTYQNFGATKQFEDFQKLSLTQLQQSNSQRNQFENDIFQMKLNIYKEQVDQQYYNYNKIKLYFDNEIQSQNDLKPSILYHLREEEKQKLQKSQEDELYDEQLLLAQQTLNITRQYRIHDYGQYYYFYILNTTFQSLEKIGFYQYIQKLTKQCNKLTLEQLATQVNKEMFIFYNKIIQQNKDIEPLWIYVNNSRPYIIQSQLDPKQLIIRILSDITLYYIQGYVFYLLDDQYYKQNDQIAIVSAYISQKQDIYDYLEIIKENQDPDNFDMAIGQLVKIKELKINSPHKILKIILQSLQMLQITIQKFSLSADELIPLLIFIFANARLPNFHSLFKFSQLFNCGCLTDEEMNILIHFEFVDNWFLQQN